MATVTGLTAERMLAIEAASVVGGEIDESGHLILSTYGGTEIDAGDALITVPDESLVKLLDADGYSMVTPTNSYPDGVSLMYLTADQVADGGWTPFMFKWGTIRTIRADTVGSDAAQIWQHHHDSGAESEMWIRGGNWNGWGAWRRLLTSKDLETLNAADVALDTRIDVLEGARSLGSNIHLETDLPDAYPLGVSQFDTNASSPWSIGGGLGLIVTHRVNNTRTVQYFHQNTTHSTWTRFYHTDTGGWSRWRHLLEVEHERLSPKLTNGTWYRISTFSASQGVTNAQASGEFVITTDGTAWHQIIRIRASVSFAQNKATLSVEECAGYGTQQQFTKARIVTLNGTYNGHALEVYHVTSPEDCKYRIEMTNTDWVGSPSQVVRWGTPAFTSVAATPAAPQAVLMQRGIGFTGDWITPTLANGWINYGNGYETIGYKMEPGGIVRLKGLIRDGVIDVNGGSPMFILPEGYRPSARQLYSGMSGSSTLGRIDVYDDGRVFAGGGNNGFMSLNMINFLAMQ